MMMSEIAGAAWVLPLTFALQGISAALILARLVRGPRAVDRVVAIDALTMIAIAVIALLALFGTGHLPDRQPDGTEAPAEELAGAAPPT